MWPSNDAANAASSLINIIWLVLVLYHVSRKHGLRAVFYGKCTIYRLIIYNQIFYKVDKLLILKVDTGIDQRTIVSGIAQSFAPEEIIGKKVTVLVNLAPRKLRGVESQGMILMVENSEGKYTFINPDAKGITNSTEVK